MCRLNDENEAEIATALREAGLRLVMVHTAHHPEDIDEQVERAARLEADFVFLQPGTAFASLDAVVSLVETGRRLAHAAGLPYFVETHRNYFTENLPQILQLIERVPDIRFTADLSHLILTGEFYGWPEERATERLMPVLERTSHVHGRVSDGEAIQVDVGEGETQSAQFFVELWSIAMRHWLRGAGPGDVFVFASELGPPRYSIALPDGSEISDRWQQSLVMKQLAQRAWDKATDTSGNSFPVSAL
jgi:sugar phosphate isomerase/epimerase